MGGSILFLESHEEDAAAAAVEGIDPVVSRRRTFCRADEDFVREPAGNIVGFAQF